jgi:hypothetical protein
MIAFSRTIQFGLALLTFTWGCLAGATELESTHKQVRMFQPKQAGGSGRLNTFCLDADGNILACTSGTNDWIEVYSPDLNLIRKIKLPFAATAINISPSGSIYVGGSGKIAIVNSAGEILSEHKSPQLGDEATLKERLEKMAKERLATTLQNYRVQIDRIEAQIAKLKAADELNERDQKRLDTYVRQKELIQNNMEQFEKRSVVDPSSMIANARVRSLAVTSKNVFVCGNSLDGRGYEVWKANLDMTEPVQIASALSGCCGQFDIQANEDYLLLAENTKFQVGLLDHDGKRISSFGKSSRLGGDGFGGCCNPMNVRCCDNGDILTAESSIGTIKRFNKAGELVSVIGKAKIGGGCKHVALGFDKARDRYYIQFEDKNCICVLASKSEATELTEDEIAAKKAKEGLGSKLVGNWSTEGVAAPKKSTTAATAKSTASVSAQLTGNAKDPYLASVMKFFANGNLTGVSPNLKWEAVSENGKTLMIAMERDGVTYDLKIEFASQDQIAISVLLGNRVYSTKQYKRIVE